MTAHFKIFSRFARLISKTKTKSDDRLRPENPPNIYTLLKKIYRMNKFTSSAWHTQTSVWQDIAHSIKEKRMYCFNCKALYFKQKQY